ncbi:MAG: tetratricopeptide repeat protein [Anaerolineae bacterium]|nr:tetratricopeptide repeat protein [Anaerolineae bacterium]
MVEVLGIIDHCLQTGDLKRAEILIARSLRAAAIAPEDRADILMRRAQVRLMAEKPDDALADLQSCKDLQPGLAHTPAMLELMGDVFFTRFELAPVGFADRADADRALECYDTLIAQAPEYANLGWVLYQKGRILLSENRISEASAIFQQALGSPGQSSLAALCYERLGFIQLFEERNPAEALTLFAQAVEAYPAGENAGWLVQLHILRSRAFREQKLYAEALAAARQALSTISATAPDYRRTLAEAHRAVGEALSHIAGREQEAIDHLVEFLQVSRRPLGVDVTWSRVHETIGDLSFRLERYELAAESYTNALVFNPYHPLETALYYRIARCYYRLRFYEKVIGTVEQMQQSAAVDGEMIQDYRIFYVLGNAHFALKHYSQAATAYRQALSLAPHGVEQVQKMQTYLRFSEELSVQA